MPLFLYFLPTFCMRKLALSTAIALTSALVAMPAFAETSSNASASAQVTSSADLACMSAAVDVRETALINAQTSFNGSILSARQTLRTSLMAAFTISNNKDRRVAIKAAWKVYVDAAVKARKQFTTSMNAAWKAYATATVNCRVDVNNDSDDNDKDDRRNNRGWLKDMLKNNAKADIKVHAKSGLHLGW